MPHLTYDHASYSRRCSPDPLTPRPVILLEGILILAEEPLRRLMDIKLFIDTDADVRILRRLRRDLQERGRSFESVERQYLESVRPMHLEFVEPSKRYADLIIPEGAREPGGPGAGGGPGGGDVGDAGALSRPSSCSLPPGC